MARVIRHAIIRGRVQGVGYRAWTEDRAILLGLDGWVRNRRDGSVEALFAGAADIVAEMIAACHQGPSSSHVDAVEVGDAGLDMLALRGRAAGFVTLPTL